MCLKQIVIFCGSRDCLNYPLKPRLSWV